MEKLKTQVNYNKYNIYFSGDSFRAFEYMDNIKDVKNRVKYAIKNNEKNKNYKNGESNICSYHFISSTLQNPEYQLKRLNDKEFIIEALEDQK